MKILLLSKVLIIVPIKEHTQHISFIPQSHITDHINPFENAVLHNKGQDCRRRQNISPVFLQGKRPSTSSQILPRNEADSIPFAWMEL